MVFRCYYLLMGGAMVEESLEFGDLWPVYGYVYILLTLEYLKTVLTRS